MASDSPAGPVPPPPHPAQQVLLVTGLSGAGKTTVLNVLEDMGWEAHDHFPLPLIASLFADNSTQTPIAIGVDARTRGFGSAAVLECADALAAREDVDFTLLFLDCSDEELTRRYNETRRPHPLAADRPAEHGIEAERELMAPLSAAADMVIDTSDLTTNQLQQMVRGHFADTATRAMTITISSFGFARGTPPLADLLFDVRFIDNPHWVPNLRRQTGLDAGVAAHIENDPAFAPAFGRISDLLLDLVPRYAAQGRSYLNIAFGCTGGRHRSVYCAQRAAALLRDAGFSPTVLHRNLAAAERVDTP